MDKEPNKEEFMIKRITITKPDGSKIHHEMLFDDYGFSIHDTITFLTKMETKFGDQLSCLDSNKRIMQNNNSQD